MLNAQPQQPHQLGKLSLRLRFLIDDFFAPLELIQTHQQAVPFGRLLECFTRIPRAAQRRVPQPRQIKGRSQSRTLRPKTTRPLQQGPNSLAAVTPRKQANCMVCSRYEVR